MAVYLAGALLALGGLASGHRHAAFGAANTVTLIRFSLVAVLIAALPAAAGPAMLAVPALGGVAGARRGRRLAGAAHRPRLALRATAPPA